MLRDLSTRLEKNFEQKRLKLRLEQDLLATQTALQEQTSRFETLSAQLDEEKIDVEQLEGRSLTALFSSILGDREQQLEIERQELLAAQLAYLQSKRQKEYLEREQDRLTQQLTSLGDVESHHEMLLAEKEKLLGQTNNEIAEELLFYSQQMARIRSDSNEISEALSAGESVISSLDHLIATLSSAENWGTWDLIGGGIFATAIKHSKIDEARNALHDVQIKMNQLTRELADVQTEVELQVEIDELLTFADYFIDNLITDWIVQSKIVNSLGQAKKAREDLIQGTKELKKLVRQKQDKINSLQDKRAQLIESA